MKRIAVVEDELYMREELCSLLRKAGYEAWRSPCLRTRRNR